MKKTVIFNTVNIIHELFHDQSIFINGNTFYKLKSLHAGFETILSSNVEIVLPLEILLSMNEPINNKYAT